MMFDVFLAFVHTKFLIHKISVEHNFAAIDQNGSKILDVAGDDIDTCHFPNVHLVKKPNESATSKLTKCKDWEGKKMLTIVHTLSRRKGNKKIALALRR